VASPVASPSPTATVTPATVGSTPAQPPPAGTDSGSGFLKAVTALVLVLAAFGKKIVAKVKGWIAKARAKI
jgi:hypothetical protein